MPMTNDDKESETYEEEENTIFSSEEDEPIGTPIPAISVKKKDSGSGEAQSLKRPTEETTPTATEVNPKRAKKVITVQGEEKIGKDSKKLSCNRLWNEENEIALLKGVIDFKADTGKTPLEDWHGFYRFVKKFITLDATLRQYVDKIRSLKRKYLRKTNNGSVEPNSFFNANDRNCFELSKVIWGSQGICSLKSDVKSIKKKTNSLKQELFTSPPNPKEVEDGTSEDLIRGGPMESPKSDWFEKSVLVRSIEILGVDEESVKERWSKVPMETKKKFEEMWKLVKAKEFECLLQKTDFLHQVASVIAEKN